MLDSASKLPSNRGAKIASPRMGPPIQPLVRSGPVESLRCDGRITVENKTVKSWLIHLIVCTFVMLTASNTFAAVVFSDDFEVENGGDGELNA